MDQVGAAEALVLDAPGARVLATAPASQRPAPATRSGFITGIVALLRTAGALTATIVLITTLSLSAYYISRLTMAGEDGADAMTGLLLSIGAGAVFGCGLMYLCERVYAKVMFAILAAVLITAGLMMMTFAPVLRQMNTPGLAEYRAFNTLMLFGALATAAGITLGALCVRWATRPHALHIISRWSRLLGSMYGVMLGIYGVILTLAMLRLINGESSFDEEGLEFSVIEQTLGLTMLAMWLLVPGILLTYHGISASMGERSQEFRPPIAVVVVGAWAAVIVIGQANMMMDTPIAAPMPVLHTLAAVMPGIALAALAMRGSIGRGRPVRWLTWRQVTLAFALSMAMAAMIAMYVNSLGGLAATVLLLVQHGAFANDTTSDDVFTTISEAVDILSRREQWAANLLAIAVVPPLCEEFAKGLSARFMMRATTTRAQAFALGAAAGAGFGFLEAMLYGAGGVTDDLANWWAIMVLRGGSTSLHVLATGLVALAWWYWSFGGNRRVALGLFGLAVLFHALWNGFAVTLYSQILWLETLADMTLAIVAYTTVGGVAAAFVVAIPLVAKSLRDRPPAPVAGTPLASMAPWLG